MFCDGSADSVLRMHEGVHKNVADNKLIFPQFKALHSISHKALVLNPQDGSRFYDSSTTYNE